MQQAGEAAQKRQNDIDPEIIIDFAFLQIDGKRWDKKTQNDLQNFIVHRSSFSFGFFKFGTKPLYSTIT